MPGYGLKIRPGAQRPPIDRLLYRLGVVPLPAWVDLRGDAHGRGAVNYRGGSPTPAAPVGPVQDQGQEGSCVAHAASELVEALRVAAGAPFLRLSPRYLYNETRAIEGDPAQDDGSDPGDALKVVLTEGVAPRDDAPYVPGQFAQVMTPEQKALAWAYRIGSYHQVPDYATAKQVLATGTPVTVCVRAYDAWDAVGADGVLPATLANETRDPNHEVLLVGYWSGYAILQNQWGTSWGAAGIAFVPEMIADTCLSDMFTASLAA